VINLKKLNLSKWLPWVVVGFLAFLIGFGVFRIVTTIAEGKGNPPEKVCFCHNWKHNPHTICTAKPALIKAHMKHVREGFDKLGRCPECPPAEECPTECGYEGGTVPDGKCGEKRCRPTEPCPPVCGEPKYSCEACQNNPDDYRKRLGVCYDWFVEYCGETYGCGWQKSNDLVACVECNGRDWVCEDTCEEPELTPTPTETPKDEPRHEPGPAGAPMCQDPVPGNVPNMFVLGGVPNDNCVTVRWWPPEGADKVHIRYSEVDGEWRYGLNDTPNDGEEEICGLKNGVHYFFQVAGVNGCAVGPWSSSFDPLP